MVVNYSILVTDFGQLGVVNNYVLMMCEAQTLKNESTCHGGKTRATLQFLPNLNH